MSDRTQDQLLRVLLVASALIFIFGIGALMRLWPAGFAWTPGQAEYELMFVAVCATLGVFLLGASREPGRHCWYWRRGQHSPRWTNSAPRRRRARATGTALRPYFFSNLRSQTRLSLRVASEIAPDGSRWKIQVVPPAWKASG